MRFYIARTDIYLTLLGYNTPYVESTVASLIMISMNWSIRKWRCCKSCLYFDNSSEALTPFTFIAFHLFRSGVLHRQIVSLLVQLLQHPLSLHPKMQVIVRKRNPTTMRATTMSPMMPTPTMKKEIDEISID